MELQSSLLKMGSFCCEKMEGKKSHDTIPLKLFYFSISLTLFLFSANDPCSL